MEKAQELNDLCTVCSVIEAMGLIIEFVNITIALGVFSGIILELNFTKKLTPP